MVFWSVPCFRAIWTWLQSDWNVCLHNKLSAMLNYQLDNAFPYFSLCMFLVFTGNNLNPAKNVGCHFQSAKLSAPRMQVRISECFSMFDTNRSKTCTNNASSNISGVGSLISCDAKGTPWSLQVSFHVNGRPAWKPNLTLSIYVVSFDQKSAT